VNDRARRVRIAAMFVGAIVITALAAAIQHSHHPAPATRVIADATTVPAPSTVHRTHRSLAVVTAPKRSTPTTARPVSTTTPPTTRPPSATTTPLAAAAASAATTPSTPSARGGLGAVRGRTIVIDAGHNGGNGAHASEIARPIFIGTMTRACDTTGTETDNGYTEAAYNLDVALRLRAVLAAAGANVVMVRTTNDGWGPCIDERAAIGNRAGAAAAISIHADGGPAGGRGFHVLTPAFIPNYTDDIYGASKRLGIDVRNAFETTGMPTSNYIGVNGLIERSDLGGLNLSNVPKVFIETGNMRNATDAGLLSSSDFREREANALAHGLANYLAGQ
jgi:N-acetylmuramoyl-L-alanine amidase